MKNHCCITALSAWCICTDKGFCVHIWLFFSNLFSFSYKRISSHTCEIPLFNKRGFTKLSFFLYLKEVEGYKCLYLKLRPLLSAEVPEGCWFSQYTMRMKDYDGFYWRVEFLSSVQVRGGGMIFFRYKQAPSVLLHQYLIFRYVEFWEKMVKDIKKMIANLLLSEQNWSIHEMKIYHWRVFLRTGFIIFE